MLSILSLPDASFYLVAIPAVILVGLAKGGMGEALSLMGVPLLTLVAPPVQAAAILLPILIVMDGVSLFMWRYSDRTLLKLMLPGALVGIAFGWATSAIVPGDVMRLVIGTVTVVFALRYFRQKFSPGTQEAPARGHRPLLAGLWSSLAGYGSFVAHAGGPPFQIYALPLKLDPRVYTGTIVRFFAIINLVKLLPYALLGQLDGTNLAISLSLLPFAPVATAIGALVVRRIKPGVFYPVMYAMALISGLKLLQAGIAGLY